MSLVHAGWQGGVPEEASGVGRYDTGPCAARGGLSLPEGCSGNMCVCGPVMNQTVIFWDGFMTSHPRHLGLRSACACWPGAKWPVVRVPRPGGGGSSGSSLWDSACSSGKGSRSRASSCWSSAAHSGGLRGRIGLSRAACLCQCATAAPRRAHGGGRPVSPLRGHTRADTGHCRPALGRFLIVGLLSGLFRYRSCCWS